MLTLLGKVFAVKWSEENKIFPQHAIHESVLFGVLLAIVGGFLDAYTFIGRGGVFANAQTGNIVLIGVYAAKGEWRQALVYIPPIVAFIAGVLVTESIKNNSSRLIILDWARLVIIIEIAVLIIIGFIPYTVPDSVVTVAISFVASIQVSSFRKLVDSPYSTTMSTGNLRAASYAAYTAFCEKDSVAAFRAIRFIIIILAFLIGAILGGFFTINIGVKAVWGAVVVLLGALIMFGMENKKEKR